MLWALIGWLFLCLFIGLLYLCQKKVPLARKLAVKLKNLIFWGLIIIMLLETYLELLVGGFETIHAFRWGNTAEIIDTSIGMGIGLFFSSLPFLLYAFIQYKKHKFDDEAFKIKCGEIYQHFKNNSINALLYNFYFLFRRLIFGISLIFFSDHPVFQLIVVTTGSYMIILYTIRV
jgi:hypothetical protein